MRSESDLEEKLGRLSARLEALEDERAIRDVLDRYGWHADHGEHKDWVGLFADDGVINLVGGVPSGGGVDHMRWHGAAELSAFIDAPDMHMKIEGRCMHLPALDLRIEHDGTNAVAEGCSLVILQEADGLHLYGAGFTRWRLRKDRDQWRIQERTRVAVGTGAG